jgi:hypothetical protein
MGCVFPAELAVFFEFQPVRVVKLALGGRIISAFALGTSKIYDYPVLFFAMAFSLP